MDRDYVEDQGWRPYDRDEGYWRDRGPYGPGYGRDRDNWRDFEREYDRDYVRTYYGGRGYADRNRDYGYYRGPGREGGYSGYGVYGYGSYGGYGGYGGYRNYDDRAYGQAGGYADAYAGPDWIDLDWSAPGPHTGRGPAGYRRSDERIQEEVCDRLTEHGRIDASDIEVKVANGEVTLSGTVDSRVVKRTAEAVAETVMGVRDVHNHLRIAEAARGRS